MPNGSRFREHLNVARDLLIGSAVFLYFIGFIYMYYYLGNFGVSLFAYPPPPQLVYEFAFQVLSNDVRRTALCVFVLIIIAFGYNFWIENLASLQKPTQDKVVSVKQDAPSSKNSSKSNGASKGVKRPWLFSILNCLVIGAPVAGLFVAFPLAFNWAHDVAQANAASRFYESHVRSRHSLKLFENGSFAKSIPGFHAVVEKINVAGVRGRAIQVAETADRLFILVGSNDASNLYDRNEDDRVYAVNKSLIAAEDMWAR